MTSPGLTPHLEQPTSAPRMVQSLGLFSSTALVIGSMIGSGIFIVEADIARGTDSPALLVAAWVVTAILTLIGALSYGELAAMMPKAGGQYVYLREALGPLWGFLYGWTLFLVIQTGTIAAVAVAFGKFLGVFFPSVSTTHWLWHIAHVPPIPIGPMVLGNMDIGVNTANLTGILVVFLLAIVNIFGVKLGALIQNVFTSAKALSLAGLVLLAFTIGRNATAWAANFGPGLSQFWRNAGWSTLHPIQVGIGGPIVLVNLAVIVAAVQVGSLFSSDAWNNITFTAGEVKNPKRNIPLSLILGTGFVSTVYILASLGYLLVLPLHGDPHGVTVLARGVQYASEDRVGTAALEQIFHTYGAWLMAGAILISTFGCANGLTLAGARVYYAMSRDGLFFNPSASSIRVTRLPQPAFSSRPCGPPSSVSPALMASFSTTSSSPLSSSTSSPSSRCSSCASNSPTPCVPTKLLAIPFCPRFISSWPVGFVSYYCDTSPSTRGPA